MVQCCKRPRRKRPACDRRDGTLRRRSPESPDRPDVDELTSVVLGMVRVLRYTRRYIESELRTTTYARPLGRDERRAGREASSSDRSHAHRTAKGPKTDRTPRTDPATATASRQLRRTAALPLDPSYRFARQRPHHGHKCTPSPTTWSRKPSCKAARAPIRLRCIRT
jgi:hypothetical protein